MRHILYKLLIALLGHIRKLQILESHWKKVWDWRMGSSLHLEFILSASYLCPHLPLTLPLLAKINSSQAPLFMVFYESKEKELIERLVLRSVELLLGRN